MDDENQGEISLEGRAHACSTTAEKPKTSSETQPGIDDTLASINKNMSTMADILQKMYTQRETNVTSQPLRGKRPKNHADGISQVLDDLAKSLGDDNDDKSLDIQPKLAEIITKRWGKKLTPEKLKGLIEKYNRPGNCPLLICKKPTRKYGAH